MRAHVGILAERALWYCRPRERSYSKESVRYSVGTACWIGRAFPGVVPGAPHLLLYGPSPRLVGSAQHAATRCSRRSRIPSDE